MPTTASPHAAPCCMKNLPTLTSLCPPRSNWRLDARLGSNRIARRHREIVRGAAPPFVAALPGPPPECFSSFAFSRSSAAAAANLALNAVADATVSSPFSSSVSKNATISRPRLGFGRNHPRFAPQITGTRAGGRFATESKNASSPSSSPPPGASSLLSLTTTSTFSPSKSMRSSAPS